MVLSAGNTKRASVNPAGTPRRGTDPRSFVPVTGNRVLMIAVLLVTCLVAYGSSLRHGFVSDDLHLIVDRLASYERSTPVGEAFTHNFWKGGGYGALPGEAKDYYRPLITLSYALDARIWHGRPFGFHLTNLLLHFATCWLLMRLLVRLGTGSSVALAATVLFAAHPIHVASVSWISGRTDVMCAAFLLLALDRLSSSLEAGMTHGQSVTGTYARLATGLIAYLLALLSKEMAIVLPGLLFIYVALLRARAGRIDGPRLPWRWTELAALVAVTMIYIAFRAAVLGLPDLSAGARSATVPHRWAMLPTVLVYYWRAFIYPGPLQLEVSHPPVDSLADPRLLAGIVLLALQLTLTVRFIRRGQIAGFGLGWILVSLLPISHLVPLVFRALVTEYWAYVPSIGFVLFLGGIAPMIADWIRRGALPARTATRHASIGLGALALAGMIWVPFRSAPLRSEETSLLDQVKRRPDHVEAWMTLATEYGSRGDLRRGLDCIGEAVRRGPGIRGVQLTLGNLYDLSGQRDSAEAAFRREIRNHPESDEARASLADICLRKGDFIEAGRLYDGIVRDGRLPTADLIARARQIGEVSADPRGSLPVPRRQEGLRLAAGTLASLHAAGVALAPPACLDWLEWELRLGRFDEATQALDVLLTTAPSSSEDRVADLAILVAILRAEPGAVERAADLWKTKPDAARHASELLSLYAQTGRSAIAIPAWRGLLRAGAASPEEINHAAVVALKGGEDQPADAAGAAGIWSMLLEEIPDQPLALLNLGGIAFSAGNRAECRARWTRFLALYPDRPEAASVRQKLAGL